MPRDIGTNLTPEANKLHGDNSWIWLFQVNLSDSEYILLTNHDASVTWDSKTFAPWDIHIEETPEEKGGNFSTVEIKASNPDQVVSERLRQSELIGQTILVTLIHKDHLTDTSNYIRNTFTVLAATVEFSSATVTITAGIRNWLQASAGRRFRRVKCHHVYGGSACGYDTTRAGAISTCDLSLNGTNGCEVHGDDEASNGLRRLHPERFGGFPGMPRQNRG